MVLQRSSGSVPLNMLIFTLQIKYSYRYHVCFIIYIYFIFMTFMKCHCTNVYLLILSEKYDFKLHLLSLYKCRI